MTDWPTPPSDYPDDTDLACGCPNAFLIVGGLVVGLAATAGWIVRTAWAVTHRSQSLAWVRSVR